MYPEIRKPAIQFSLFFLAACLLTLPFAGSAPLLAWLLVTGGLIAFGRAVARKRPTNNFKKPRKRKSR